MVLPSTLVEMLLSSDSNHAIVVRLDSSSGRLSRIAGNGTFGFSGDNGPATSASLGGPGGLALDRAGNLYIADPSNDRVRKVDKNGVITTVAGDGTLGGPATSTSLVRPNYVAVDSAGNLYIQDYGSVTNNGVGYGLIRKVTPDGTTTIVAGGGTSFGDNGPATSAQLTSPQAIAVDGAGNLYIADSSRIRKVTSDGIITTIAGNGTSQDSGDGGPAINAPGWPSSGAWVGFCRQSVPGFVLSNPKDRYERDHHNSSRGWHLFTRRRRLRNQREAVRCG